MNISIEDKTSPALQKLLGQLTQRQPLMTRLGKTLEVELRGHFAQKEGEPNQRGWPKQHFWSRIRRATAFTGADNDSASVTISDPAFWDKVNPPGTYTKAIGAYAIPLRREAAGVTPRSGTIAGLFLLRSRAGRAFLAKRDDTGFHGAKAGARKKMSRGDGPSPEEPHRLTLYYLLSKTRKHAPDPTALPPSQTLAGILLDRTREYLSNI